MKNEIKLIVIFIIVIFIVLSLLTGCDDLFDEIHYREYASFEVVIPQKNKTAAEEWVIERLKAEKSISFEVYEKQAKKRFGVPTWGLRINSNNYVTFIPYEQLDPRQKAVVDKFIIRK